MNAHCYGLASALVLGEELTGNVAAGLCQLLPGCAHLSVALVSKEGSHLLHYPVLEGAAPVAGRLAPVAKCADGTAAWHAFCTGQVLQLAPATDRARPLAYADWEFLLQQQPHQPSAHLVTAPLQAAHNMLGSLTARAAVPARLDLAAMQTLTAVLGECLAHMKCNYDLAVAVGLLRKTVPAHVVERFFPHVRNPERAWQLHLPAEQLLDLSTADAQARTQQQQQQGMLGGRPLAATCWNCSVVNFISVPAPPSAAAEAGPSTDAQVSGGCAAAAGAAFDAAAGAQQASAAEGPGAEGATLHWDLRFCSGALERRFTTRQNQQLSTVDAAHAALFGAAHVAALCRLGHISSHAPWLNMLGVFSAVLPYVAQRALPRWYRAHREPLICVLRIAMLACVAVHTVLWPGASAAARGVAAYLLAPPGVPVALYNTLVRRVRFAQHLVFQPVALVIALLIVTAQHLAVGCGKGQGAAVVAMLGQVVFCMLLPSLMLYCSELRSRRVFLRERAASDGKGKRSSLGQSALLPAGGKAKTC